MRFGATPKEIGPFSDTWEEVELAERVGFDACWVSEHHVQPDGGVQYWPASLLRLAAIGARTESLDLVTSVYILPFHHPLEVAEKVAVLDQLSNGRVTLGIGLGYVAEEFEAFNIPIEERAGRFVEGFRILDRYLSSEGSFSFDGNFWSISDWDVEPTSVQDPRPSILVGGWGDLALKRSLRLGDGWIAGLTGDVAALAERKEKLEAFRTEFDMETGNLSIPVMRETIVAETHEEAINLGKQYLHNVYKETYGSIDWSHPLLSPDEVTNFEKLVEDRFLIGSPNEIVEQIETLRDQAGVTEVGCRFHFPGMEHETIMREIELFGDEIIPAFQ